MAKGINKVILIGTLGADPEIKNLNKGNSPDFRIFSKSPSYKALLKNKGTTLFVFFNDISRALHLHPHQLINFDSIRADR